MKNLWRGIAICGVYAGTAYAAVHGVTAIIFIPAAVASILIAIAD